MHAEPAVALAASRAAQAEWKTLPHAARDTDDVLGANCAISSSRISPALTATRRSGRE